MRLDSNRPIALESRLRFCGGFFRRVKFLGTQVRGALQRHIAGVGPRSLQIRLAVNGARGRPGFDRRRACGFVRYRRNLRVEGKRGEQQDRDKPMAHEDTSHLSNVIGVNRWCQATSTNGSALRALVLISHQMKKAIVIALCLAGSALAQQYTKDGELMRPKDYREWIFLSSGIGMTYTGGSSQNPAFENVFVNPEAYREFLKTGIWPDKTVLILEIRASESRVSINKDGRVQTKIAAMEAHVKDSARGGW